MRLPLIRQGEGAAGFHRILTELAAQQNRIDHNIQAAPTDHGPSRATAAGDSRKLRGIPAIGRGVQGCIPGTRPGANL